MLVVAVSGIGDTVGSLKLQALISIFSVANFAESTGLTPVSRQCPEVQAERLCLGTRTQVSGNCWVRLFNAWMRIVDRCHSRTAPLTR